MQALIRIEAVELTDDSGREHLATCDDRHMRAQPAFAAQVADAGRDAECDDESPQIRTRPTAAARARPSCCRILKMLQDLLRPQKLACRVNQEGNVVLRSEWDER